MTGPSERLLGFDAREALPGPGLEWGRERRRGFLLRPEVERPLSVDAVVWPALFDLDDGPERPTWTGPIQDLWQDLAELEESLELWRSRPGVPHRIVAVTLEMSGRGAEHWKPWEDRTLPTRPPLRDRGWPLLGYDVADSYLLSGLANLGLPEDADRVEALRERWGPRLNSCHLFADPQHASSYRRRLDRYSPGHAPYWVFGLWQVARWP